MKSKRDQFDSFADRVRRSQREIIVAAVLTVAAFAFLLATMFGSSVVTTQKVGSVASEEALVK